MKFASAVVAACALASAVSAQVENAEIRRLVQTLSQNPNIRNIRNLNFDMTALEGGSAEPFSNQANIQAFSSESNMSPLAFSNQANTQAFSSESNMSPQAFSSEENPQAYSSESSNQWMSQSEESEQPQPFSSFSEMNMASPWSSQSEEKPAWSSSAWSSSAREEKPAWSAREEELSSEEPSGKKIHAPQGRVTSRVAAPMMTSPRTLGAQELPVQIQSYKVPLTKNHVENVEQPIIQQVVQPYHQRILRQPQPRVQPYNTRVIQPVILQEVQPVLSTVVETAKPLQAQFLAPIQNADVTLAPRTSSTTKPLMTTAPRTVGKKNH